MSLRVAVFAYSFPLPSETFVVRQVADLVELGHDVHVFAEEPPADGPVSDEAQRLSGRTHYVDMPPAARFDHPVLPITGETWAPGAETPERNLARIARAVPAIASVARRAPRLAARLLTGREDAAGRLSLALYYRLAAAAAQGRFDVAHVHFGPVGQLFAPAARMWGAPLVLSFHGYDFSTYPREHGRGVYSQLLAACDAVTANSRYTAGRLEELGCPPERIHLLPMGVDLRAFSPPPDRPARTDDLRVLTVGRLTGKKGIEFSLRAFARLRRSIPQAKYDIVGDGPLRTELATLARELQVADAVTFHGAQDREVIRGLLWDADVFVLASVVSDDGDVEGQGVVLLEAQACELPVIATDHGGFPDTISPGRTGFLVPERDVDALAEHLERLARHPQLRRELGTAGRRWVAENFDSNALAQRLEQLYATVIEARTASPRPRARAARARS